MSGAGDLAAAYARQADLVRDALAGGCSRGGWKIGLTSLRMQQMCHTDAPIAGMIFAERIVSSGAVLSVARYGRLALEFEIGLVLATDLPARSAPYAAADVGPVVAAICPAIEIVDDRNADYAAFDVGAVVAENSWNAGAVCGPRSSGFPDLATLEGTVYRDDAVLDRGFGRDVLGHPFNALAWLANHLLAGGDMLRAATW